MARPIEISMTACENGEPALVHQLVAQTLDVHLVAGEPMPEALSLFLCAKQLLLILDNCEHLSEACALLAQELLFHARELRSLATSREVLAVTGEMVYPVSGLAWPASPEQGAPMWQSRLDLEAVMSYDAIRLFVERARTSMHHFSLTP